MVDVEGDQEPTRNCILRRRPERARRWPPLKPERTGGRNNIASLQAQRNFLGRRSERASDIRQSSDARPASFHA